MGGTFDRFKAGVGTMLDLQKLGGVGHVPRTDASSGKHVAIGGGEQSLCFNTSLG